jgi:hypothetical protein
MVDDSKVAEVEAAIAAAAALPPLERLRRLHELDEEALALDAPHDARLQAEVRRLELALAATAAGDPAALDAVRKAASAMPWKEYFITALGHCDDDATFQLVRERAQKQLEVEYYDTKPAWLFALGELAQFPRFADDARGLLLGGFDHLVAKTRAAKERTLVNSVAFGALAHAVAELSHPQTGPALRKAFEVAAGQTDVRAHYELNVTCGALAVALAAVDHVEALPALDTFLARYADDYAGDGFVMQVLYSKWLLSRDGAAPLAYVTSPANKKGLAYAAAALADLHHVVAYELLAARAKSLEHPVAQEAFAEAKARLSHQATPPPVTRRMIWMFGRKSPTEQALGEDSDNVFVQRAIARTKDEQLGVVTEADDSAPVDG